jgi:hypothetical protein
MRDARATSSAGFERSSRRRRPRKNKLEINDTIREVIALTRSELHRTGTLLRSCPQSVLPLSDVTPQRRTEAPTSSDQPRARPRDAVDR